MGYKNRYSDSGRTPIEKLNNEWNKYKKYLESLDYQVNITSYDPFAPKNFIKEYEWDRELSTELHLYLLPKPFQTKSITDLIDESDIPKKPTINESPKISLPKNEYPASYFETNSKSVINDSENNIFFKAGSIVGKLLNSENPNQDTDIKIQVDKKTPYELEIEERNQIIENANNLRNKIDDKWKFFYEQQTLAKNKIVKLQESLSASDSEKLISIVNDKYELPIFLRKVFKSFVDEKNQIKIIQFEFPDYTNQSLIVNYSGRYHDKPKFASDTLKKKLVKNCLYSMIIRSAYLAAKYCNPRLFKNVVVNVEQNWFDLATGQPKNGIIASLQAPVEYLHSLDLSKLDPETCFKFLKGISTPNLQNASPIRPIFTLNKQDDRLVESKDIESGIEPEANLAAMEWEDFEHLVAQLFEWEFKKIGIEVRVTRASRDRGVDAILFDPDPLKGGKYVIQAKRYTRTVDVSAVRDLYGTVMNEGANRGILITTASYGPDAYDFAKDKPISLVDGPNLLLMLNKHGKNFKIDLEEARRLSNDS